MKAPSGVQPAFAAASSDMTTHALAPSDSWEALPAVTVPSFLKTVGRDDSLCSPYSCGYLQFRWS